MKKEHMEILTNIIGAVESGGQIYGKRRYDAYAGKAANSSNEKTCTLGWAQNYGNEGRRLCKMIFQKDPASFRKADTANIEKMLNVDWVAKGWDPSASEKKALIAIITTTAGKECQDKLFQELMEQYVKEAENYGVAGVQAQMMWCEIEHLGGLGPVKRIFGRAAKPYTPDRIFESLLLDQKDSSNNNQVGDKMYQSRHECCLKWIKQYVAADESKEEINLGKTAQDVLNVMRGWLGYSEANGKFKQIIDLYNSVKPLPRGYAVKYTDEWCDTTVSAAGIKAGCTELIGRECGCEEHVKIFKSMGIWIEDGTITPLPGDIILYNWDKATQPNDGYSDHIGFVESVSGGQITCIEGNKGETVARRVISVGNGYIRGYARPKYSGTGTVPSNPVTLPSAGSELNKSVTWYGVVNTGSLNVRTWAGTENAQLKSYPSITQGTKVGVCETVKDKDGDPWYYIKIDGNQGTKYGFVSAVYITKQENSSPSNNASTPDKTSKWVGKVTATTLNVRSWAGVNNPTIKSWPQLGDGNLVDVCDTVIAADRSRWYYIRIAGQYYGFVHSAYISRV